MPKPVRDSSGANRYEVRHRIVTALLQADGPLTLDELIEQGRVAKGPALAALEELAANGLVVQGPLLEGVPGEQYRWAARWEADSRRQAAAARRKLQETTNPAQVLPAGQLGIDSPTIRAFHDYIVHDYTPPKDKRMLVFFQCSVRRPFSTSPSHASMRRGVEVATGFDPARDFDRCPVHVVVLASTIGPVPYELEDVYPANVGGLGVKQFSGERYQRVRPFLASRMAEYITVHRGSYDHVAAFADGRYGEVVAEAGKIAGAELLIFPDKTGPIVLRVGPSRPRTYWQKYWIQLSLAIAGWMGPTAQRQMSRRLKERLVEYA